MKNNKDEIICRYNEELEKQGSKVPTIMLATDTYDMLIGNKMLTIFLLFILLC